MKNIVPSLYYALPLKKGDFHIWLGPDIKTVIKFGHSWIWTYYNISANCNEIYSLIILKDYIKGGRKLKNQRGILNIYWVPSPSFSPVRYSIFCEPCSWLMSGSGSCRTDNTGKLKSSGILISCRAQNTEHYQQTIPINKHLLLVMRTLLLDMRELMVQNICVY